MGHEQEYQSDQSAEIGTECSNRKRKDSFEAATLHVAKTNDGIIDDWQGFSNIDADNNFAMLAVLGYMHEWNSGHLFVGVRNVNEDFFTSDVTALF